MHLVLRLLLLLSFTSAVNATTDEDLFYRFGIPNRYLPYLRIHAPQPAAARDPQREIGDLHRHVEAVLREQLRILTLPHTTATQHLAEALDRGSRAALMRLYTNLILRIIAVRRVIFIDPNHIALLEPTQQRTILAAIHTAAIRDAGHTPVPTQAQLLALADEDDDAAAVPSANRNAGHTPAPTHLALADDDDEADDDELREESSHPQGARRPSALNFDNQADAGAVAAAVAEQANNDAVAVDAIRIDLDETGFAPVAPADAAQGDHNTTETTPHFGEEAELHLMLFPDPLNDHIQPEPPLPVGIVPTLPLGARPEATGRTFVTDNEQLPRLSPGETAAAAGAAPTTAQPAIATHFAGNPLRLARAAQARRPLPTRLPPLVPGRGAGASRTVNTANSRL